jgi:hypothetical protein
MVHALHFNIVCVELSAREVGLVVYNSKKPVIFRDIFVLFEGHLFAGHF